MRRFTIIAGILATVSLTAGIVACGGDDEGNGAATAAATTRAAVETSASGGAETAIEVDAADFSFDPDTFTVAAGEDVTITLNNTGEATHTLTVYTDEDFSEPIEGADTGNVSAGAKGEFTNTFDAGEYYFRCDRHPTQMQGEFQAE